MTVAGDATNARGTAVRNMSRNDAKSKTDVKLFASLHERLKIGHRAILLDALQVRTLYKI